MNTKEMINAAILLAVGTVLHYVIPGFVAGVKPDFMLACVFVIIMIKPNVKTALSVAVVSGLLAALTTQFPGGQIPSLIDKLVSSFALLLMAKTFPLGTSSIGKQISKGLMFFLGTLVSGLVFLSSALVLVGLPGGASMTSMFVAIVLPTALANVVFGLLVYKLVASYSGKLARI